MRGTHLIVGLGELLWDVYPHGKKLGGAPANFAYISGLLGERAVIASRVGNDALGREVLAQISSAQLDASCIQSDSAHPTGTVQVSLDTHGQASFEITRGAAWDFFELTPVWRHLAQQADAVCFGSLAQRSINSRRTIGEFLHCTRPAALKIFDVNLRQSFYSAAILSDSIKHSQILKLNSEELPTVLSVFGESFQDEISAARCLREEFNLQMVCVTRAARGSLLLTARALHEHPGFPAKVVDTVGAGDAFTAALVYHYLRGASLETMNVAANRMGTWVATQSGAMPPASAAELATIRSPEKILQAH